MQFSFRPTQNTISPDLIRKLKAVEDPRPALGAAGLVLESIAKRAFKEPSLRPAPWSPLAPATVKEKTQARKSTAVLIRDAILIRSPRVTEITRTSVTVGTDRPYARYHQDGKGRMYRPFFPVDKNGNLTAYARDRIEAAIRRKLALAP